MKFDLWKNNQGDIQPMLVGMTPLNRDGIRFEYLGMVDVPFTTEKTHPEVSVKLSNKLNMKNLEADEREREIERLENILIKVSKRRDMWRKCFYGVFPQKTVYWMRKANGYKQQRDNARDEVGELQSKLGMIELLIQDGLK